MRSACRAVTTAERYLLSSQTPRAPMLLFEFVGELFQFEEREPEFAPLFQLPPRMTASLSRLPLAFLFHDPSAHDLAHFCDQRKRCFTLVRRNHGTFQA